MMDYYKDQMIQTMAAETTNQNSIGLAQMLYEQMKRNFGAAQLPTEGDSAAESVQAV